VVLAETPPEDAGRIAGWIETLAERWLAPAAKI
jgi:hypothetical protein